MTTDVGSFKSYQLSEGRTTPVSARVSPTDRIRGEIDALFDGSRELSEVIEDVARLGARLIIQTAVEAEVDVFLGRARYQRAAGCAEARPGMRNGYCDSTIKTTAGPVTVARPKLRDTTERFASQLFGKGVTKSNALESLVIAGFVRGLSVRDVENTLADALGAEAALSKSTVSRVCQAIAEEFEAWSSRRLDEAGIGLPVPGRFHVQDAPRCPCRTGAGRVGHHHRRRAGIRRFGRRRIGVDRRLGRLPQRTPGAWAAPAAAGHLRRRGRADQRRRDRAALLAAPALSDSSLPQCSRQGARRGAAIFDTDELIAGGMAPGPKLVAAVQHRIDAVADTYARTYPAAVKCLLVDREQLTSYLRFPVEHHRRIRHSNFIERTFGETRRRVKVIGRLPGETSCLNLVWAVLDRASRDWRGMTMTPTGTRLLADLRHQLLDPPTPIRKPNTNINDAETVGAVA